MKLFKSTIFMCLIILFYTGNVYAASEQEMRANINHAGKLNTRTQKIAKHAVLISSGFDKKINKKGLKKSADLFDKTIKLLINGGKNKFGVVKVENKEIQIELASTLKDWKEFYKYITKKTYNDDTLRKIDALHTVILEKTDKIVKMLSEENRKKSKLNLDISTDMYIAAKQRTMAEKMATLSVLIMKNINTEKNIENLKNSINYYEKAINGLIDGDSDLGTHKIEITDIKNQLISIKDYWHKMKSSLEQENFTKDQVENIVSKCTELRVKMVDGVKLYERAIKKQRTALALSNIVAEMTEVRSKKEHNINLARKQGTRSQKIAKHVLLIVLGVSKEQNIKGLKKSSFLFDKTLKGFLNGDRELDLAKTNNPGIVQQLNKIQKLWTPFYENIKVITNGTIDKKAVLYIMNNNLILMKNSNKATMLYIDDNSTGDDLDKFVTNTIDLSGKLRTRIQKMTKEKLLVIGEIDVEKNRGNLKKTVNLFDKTLNGLLNGDKELGLSPITDSKIVQQLKTVESKWHKLKPLYEKEETNNDELFMIINQNDPLRIEINKVVTLLEKSIDF